MTSHYKKKITKLENKLNNLLKEENKDEIYYDRKSELEESIKLNTSKFKKASNNQMQSIEKELTSTASQRAGLNKASGATTQEISSNIGSFWSNAPNEIKVDFQEFVFSDLLS